MDDLTLKEILDMIAAQRDPVVDDLIHNPRIADGSSDFRYKSGYASGLQTAAEIITTIMKGDAR